MYFKTKTLDGNLIVINADYVKEIKLIDTCIAQACGIVFKSGHIMQVGATVKEVWQLAIKGFVKIPVNKIGYFDDFHGESILDNPWIKAKVQ